MVKRRTHTGYKKCLNNKIVKLRIIGRTNKNRKNVSKKRTAKHRCSKAMVLEIYDMYDRFIHYDTAISIHDPNLVYVVGKVIEPNSFDTNLNNIDSTGIHYFLTEKPVYHMNPESLYGPREEWYDNGQIKVRKNLKNGNLDGQYERWYDNGNMMTRCTYNDGKNDGLFESWHENGQEYVICNYKNGILDGIYKEYSKNGTLIIRFTNVNGKRNGESETWYDNGNRNVSCIYKDGILDGPYESYHSNGQTKSVSMSENGSKKYEVIWNSDGELIWSKIYKHDKS